MLHVSCCTFVLLLVLSVRAASSFCEPPTSGGAITMPLWRGYQRGFTQSAEIFCRPLWPRKSGLIKVLKYLGAPNVRARQRSREGVVRRNHRPKACF